MSDKIRYVRSRQVKRGEKDSVQVGSRNPGQRQSWLPAEAKRWYIVLGLSAIAAILLFPNFLARPKIYKLGDVVDRDIKASHEFLVEDAELTEKTRQEATRNVLSVYDFDRTANNLVSRIREAFRLGREHLVETVSPASGAENSSEATENTQEKPPRNMDALKSSFFEILDIPPDAEAFDSLVKKGFPEEVEETLIDLVNPVLQDGVVGDKMILMGERGRGIVLHDIYTEKESIVTDLERFYDLRVAKAFIKGQSQNLNASLTSKDLGKCCLKIAAMLIRPNVTFNKRETEVRKELARKSVKPIYFKVKRGEMLVREGERISPEHLVKLAEQNRFLRQREVLARTPAMAVLVCFLLASIYLFGLHKDRPGKAALKDLLLNALALLAVFLVVIASNFVASEIAQAFNFFTPRAFLYAIPVAAGAMLICVFQGILSAVSFSLIISVLASFALGSRVEFFVYFFLCSLVAAHGVKNCRERGIFIKSGVMVGASGMILALCIEALHGSLHSVETLLSCASALLGGILVGIVTTGVLPLIEMSFGYTTDIKLLELASLDQPLLREFLVRAPGSYHHSVIVSNMVEATAKAINANPLLAKVAAYYHDIGKMKKPLYFIENQMDCENKHEKLAPSMSSLILTSHVKDGVELATKHKLGREIIDIIRQHHGTSLITYFYEKAKEQAERKGDKALRVKEEDFRYPGPKPQTKEAGLVMLADAVEAASKTLVDPTGARIQGMVQKMINKVFFDGQLDECELTLKDLHEIAKSFNKTLSGIFHHRVDYPEPVTKSAAGKKGENGNSDPLGAGDPRGKKTEDKAEGVEGLRRLGMS